MPKDDLWRTLPIRFPLAEVYKFRPTARRFIELPWRGITIPFRRGAADSPAHPPDTNGSHNPQ